MNHYHPGFQCNAVDCAHDQSFMDVDSIIRKHRVQATVTFNKIAITGGGIDFSVFARFHQALRLN